MSTSHYLAYLRNSVREFLQDEDSSDYRWEDNEIESHILAAIEDVSAIVPQEKETLLPVVDGDKEVDISSLKDKFWISRVEFSPDRTDRRWRNWTEWGDYITLKIDFKPSVSAATLTGTVTFTDESVAVTGSGTAFSTECVVGNVIKMSTEETQWYKIRSVTSDTALVLARAYDGTGGVDTEDATLYRTYKEVCRVYWNTAHEVTTESSTLSYGLERLVVLGAVARAATSWGQQHLNAVMVGG